MDRAIVVPTTPTGDLVCKLRTNYYFQLSQISNLKFIPTTDSVRERTRHGSTDEQEDIM